MPMTTEPINPTPDPDSSPSPVVSPPLPWGITCCKCNYELHGLTRESFCPECATPIETSLKSDALIFASPEFLRKLRIGAEMTTWGAFAWVIVAAFAWVLQPVLSSIIEFLTQAPDLDVLAGALIYLIHFATALVLVRGIWLLTIYDERPERTQGKKWIRPTARWVLLISYGIQEFLLVLVLLDPFYFSSFLSIVFIPLIAIAPGWALLLVVVAGYYKRGRVHRLELWSRVAVGSAIASTSLVAIFFFLALMGPLLPGPMLFAAGLGLGLIPLASLALLGLTLLIAFIVFVELGSWINKARIRSEAIRAEVRTDSPFPF